MAIFFSKLGLPEILVSNNDCILALADISAFCQQNRI